MPVLTGDPEIGTYVFWQGSGHADDEFESLGGFVIDCFADPETGEKVVKVVEYWRRQIRYHVFAVDECAHGLSGPHVRQDLLKQFLIQLAGVEAEQKDPFKHLQARTALTAVVMTPGTAA